MPYGTEISPQTIEAVIHILNSLAARGQIRVVGSGVATFEATGTLSCQRRTADGNDVLACYMDGYSIGDLLIGNQVQRSCRYEADDRSFMATFFFDPGPPHQPTAIGVYRFELQRATHQGPPFESPR